MKKFIRFQSVLISLYFLYVKEILNLLDCVLRYSLRISQKKFAPLLIKCTYNCQNVHIRGLTDCITIFNCISCNFFKLFECFLGVTAQGSFFVFLYGVAFGP